MIKDITDIELVYDRYLAERNVIGEVHIDNLQSYRDYLSEEEILEVRLTVNKLFEGLAKRGNLAFKNYQEGRWWLLLDEQTLDS